MASETMVTPKKFSGYNDSRDIFTSSSALGKTDRKGPTKMSHTFESFPQHDITEEMLRDAAKLFTENYGIWGSGTKMPGKRVTLTAKRLRDQCLPEAGQCFYVRATSNGQLIGNVFTSRWKWDGKTVCWVTQLVVHKNHRGKGIATMLLRHAMAESDGVYGIMSSHPYACVAAATTFGTSIENLSLNFIQQHSDTMMKESPIQYVRAAAVCGSLFDITDSSGLICGANTGFYVDHEEPLEALRQVRHHRSWSLGELPEGHEYLLVIRAKQHRTDSPKQERKEQESTEL